MTYALIEDGLVVNLIWLHYANASDFPNAVPVSRVPVEIGDTFDGENFYRNGERVKTEAEIALAEIGAARVAYYEGVNEA